MKRISIYRLNRTDGMPSLWATGSKVALLFTVVLLLIMPWTEHFWSFDKFLRGGQDFEFGLLAIATIFCLVMVMLQHGKCSQSDVISAEEAFSRVSSRRSCCMKIIPGLIAVLHAIAVRVRTCANVLPL